MVNLRLAKIPMARPNGPDIPQKRTKKVRLGIYHTQIQPKISVTVIKSARCCTEWPAKRMMQVNKIMLTNGAKSDD